VNLLALRGNVNPVESFTALLNREGREVRAALVQQHYPFDRLVAELAPTRDPGRSPLFDVMLAYQNAGDADLIFGDAMAQPLPLPTGASQYDCTLNCFETGNGLEIVWEYDRAQFDADRMTRAATAFVTLAENLVANPQREVGHAGILREAELRQLLHWGRRVDACVRRDDTIPALVEAGVRRTPQSVAVVNAEGRWTYAELWGQVEATARRLTAE